MFYANSYVIMVVNPQFVTTFYGPYLNKELAETAKAKYESKQKGCQVTLMLVHPGYMTQSKYNLLPGDLEKLRKEEATTANEVCAPLPEGSQGYRPVMGGTHEKNLDTGEVREKPLYRTIDEFPG